MVISTKNLIVKSDCVSYFFTTKNSPAFVIIIHLYGHRLMLVAVGVGSLTAYLNPQLKCQWLSSDITWFGLGLKSEVDDVKEVDGKIYML
jgi:hypothetical protein